MVQSVLRLLVACSLWSTVHSFNIDYSSAFQCQSVALAWVKTDASETQQITFPVYLNILPFNSTATIQQIDTWDQTTDIGKALLDFPLAAGTQYLLGVTDSAGHGLGRTSSIQTALASNDSSCLTQAQTAVPFTVQPTNPDECPSLTVNYIESTNPSIFFFSPGHLPFNMADEDSQGSSGSVKTPKGKYTSFSEIVVLFKDGNGNAQTSPPTTVGGVDKLECTPPLSTSSHFTFGYRPRTAALVIAFVLAGVVTLFITVFIAFWYWRRSRKVQDEESVQAPPSSAEKGPEGSLRSFSMRTNRSSNNAYQISVISPSDRNPARRRPGLRVDVPPMPDSAKVTATPGSGFISYSPETARTDSSKGRSILRKTNPSSAKRRRFVTDKNAPSSFFTNSRGAGSSKATLRKSSAVSDVTMTDETSMTFPDILPRPDSPTVPSIYLNPKRGLKISKSQRSNRSSKRSHRDYARLVDGDDIPRRSSTVSALFSKSRSRSLTRLPSLSASMLPQSSRSRSVPRSSL